MDKAVEIDRVTCRWPGCPELRWQGHIYCEIHQRESNEIWQGIMIKDAPHYKRILSQEAEADIEAKARADAEYDEQHERAARPAGRA